MTRSYALSLFAALLVPAVAACGGNVVIDDGGPGGGGTGGGECTEFCDAFPTCAPDEYQVDSCPTDPNDSGCHDVTLCCATISCMPAGCNGGPGCGCDVPPTCPPDSFQVSSCPSDVDCFAVEDCGETIFCASGPPQCDGFPSCDPGDTQTDSCPTDVGCYTASLCGSSILCIDSTLPEHGCPQTVPDGQACDPAVDPTFCDYPTGGDCFDSYVCQDSGVWEWAGGGCTGQGG
ncbi:MAG TPA: hypothetical protein VL400_15860 [Polyangiaceae bacterium]|jgi:hypothetical protein|nr:hypothetical protein [Polyangiaceae bacterium]